MIGGQKYVERLDFPSGQNETRYRDKSQCFTCFTTDIYLSEAIRLDAYALVSTDSGSDSLASLTIRERRIIS